MDHRKTPSPTRSEDEYFVKQDAELIKAERARLDQERANLERKSHYMKCPKCGLELKEITFKGVSIDKCFHCGGMWFDDQEFETLVGHEQTNIFSSIVNVFRAKKVT